MVGSSLAHDATTPLLGAAAATVAWRFRDQLHVTVIAKATFAFAQDADMPRAPPQPILSAEVHHGDNPSRSVRFGGDLAPYLGRADVLFTGHAHATAPGPVREMRARLAIFRREGAILDKTILLREPRGFQRLPIVYERAFGGPSVPENPLGLGETADTGEPVLFDLSHPRRPAGFGPLGRNWPARKRLLGATPRKALEGPIAEIPEGFDGSYFQAAPLDQRTDFLRGDEWIVLEGLHPTLPLLRTRLPGVRGVARIHGLSAFGMQDGYPLELRADTLRIDGEEERCTLVCRQSFRVAGEDALAAVRVVAGVQVAGEPLSWCDPRENKAPATARLDDDAMEHALTLALRIEDAAPAPPVSTLALPPEQAPRAPAPVLPFREGEAAPAIATPSGGAAYTPTGTAALSPQDDVILASQGALPFVPSLSAVPLPSLPITPPPSDEHVVPAPPAPDPLTVPYFDPAPPAPAAALPPPPDPAPEPEPDLDPSTFPLERFAAVSAEIAEARAPRMEVLRAHELTEREWRAIERHWTDAIRTDAKRGPGRLRSAHDNAYVAAVEGFRGPITAAEYARLMVAIERKELDAELDALRIQRPALMYVVRLWTKKAAVDPKLGSEVGAAMAALRGR